MPLDSSIYQAVPRLRSISEYDKEAADLQNAQTAVEANKLALVLHRNQADEYGRKIGDENALRAVAKNFGADPQANAQAILKATGNVPAAQSYLKSAAEQGEIGARTKKEQSQEQESMGKVRDAAFAHYTNVVGRLTDPDQAEQFARASRLDPIIGPIVTQAYGPAEDAIQRMRGVSQTPEGFKQWQANVAIGLEKLANMAKVQQVGTGGATSTQVFQPATSEVKTVATAPITQSPDNAATLAEQVRAHNLQDARSREGNQIQRDAARSQVVPTDSGFDLVDKGTGKVTTLTYADGTPLGPKLKDAPAAVQKAMIENGTNLRRAERALELVRGKDTQDAAGAVVAEGDKSATGMKGYLPGAILNRVDPKGVDTRAAVADLGSLVIHERSGAAVTASEFPRLAPFIPLATDDAKTVEKKVKRFVQVYKEEMAATQDAYGPAAGYRQIGSGKGAAPQKPDATGGLSATEQAELDQLRNQFGRK